MAVNEAEVHAIGLRVIRALYAGDKTEHPTSAVQAVAGVAAIYIRNVDTMNGNVASVDQVRDALKTEFLKAFEDAWANAPQVPEL